MTIIQEYDTVELAVSLRGKNMFNHDEVMIEAGERGVGVLIYGNPAKASAYEVEFYYPEQNIFALYNGQARGIAQGLESVSA